MGCLHKYLNKIPFVQEHADTPFPLISEKWKVLLKLGV